MAENPLLVFVSSVTNPSVEDLSDERRVAKEAIASLRLTRPWLFEDAPASAEPVRESYLRKLREADLAVFIFGRAMTEPVEEELATARAMASQGSSSPKLTTTPNDCERIGPPASSTR